MLPSMLDARWSRHHLRWQAGGVGTLYVQPVSGGKPYPLTHFVSEEIVWFAWSKDGKQIAIARGIESSDAVLITNFR
jgi:hypothetical protein